MTNELKVHHSGRVTQLLVKGSDIQFRRFRRLLLINDFIVVFENNERLEMRRRAYVMHDDWPIRLTVKRDSNHFDIRYFLFIPWSWIISFSILIFLILPYAGVPNTSLTFLLSVIVVVLTLFKRQFDCRPTAKYWQSSPRRRWHNIIEQLIKESFQS
jgi:hypothetical protein